MFIESDSELSESEGTSRRGKGKRRCLLTSGNTVTNGGGVIRRRRQGLTARERNLRRLESNERERMRMHSLNDAFEVSFFFIFFFKSFLISSTH